MRQHKRDAIRGSRNTRGNGRRFECHVYASRIALATEQPLIISQRCFATVGQRLYANRLDGAVSGGRNPAVGRHADGGVSVGVSVGAGVAAGWAADYGVPEIICSAAGSASASTNFTSLGTCIIGTNVLQTGDRVEIHFDLAHQGTTVGFEFKSVWGQTVLMDRIADAAESMIAGKGEAGVYDGGAQLRAESWGATLAYAAGVSNATDLLVPPLTINFLVKMQQATSETMALRNFTVVRYPAR